MAGVNIPSETVEQWARVLEEMAAQVRSYLVPSPPPPPPLPTISVILIPTTIQAGQSAELTWTSTDAISVVLNGVVVDLNGRMVVQPTETQSYLFSATGLGGRVTKTVMLTVNPVEPPPPPPTTSGVTFNLAESPPYNSLYVGPYDPATGLPSKAFDIEHGVAYFLPAPNVWRVRDGYWNDPSIWNTGAVPQAGDNVAVTHLTFDLAGDRTLRVKTLAVNDTGTVTIGTPEFPVPRGRKVRISLVGGDYDPNDPQKFSRGLLSTGKITVNAEKKPQAMARTAWGLRKGDSVVFLTTVPTDWGVGDLVVFPDTRLLKSRLSGDPVGTPNEPGFVSATEVRTIVAVSIDGGALTLDAPLGFDHPAHGQDDQGNDVVLPFVGNLSRDVVVESEAEGQHHVMFGHSCEAGLDGISFVATGVTTAAVLSSTNVVKGRYPVHFHHYHGTTPPRLRHFSIYSLRPDNPTKWGLTVHGTDDGLYEEGLIYNFSGWGYGEEDGSELNNEYRNVWSVAIRTGGPGAVQQTAYGDPRTEEGGGADDLGWNGAGAWFRGNGGKVRGGGYLDCILGPVCWMKGLQRIVQGRKGPIEPRLNGLDWRGFVAGGGRCYMGGEIWYVGLQDLSALPDPAAKEIILDGCTFFACMSKHYYNYVTNKMRITNCVVVDGHNGIDGTDYAFHDLIVRNLTSYNVENPYIPSTVGESQVIEDSWFFGASTVLGMGIRWGAYGGENHPPRTVVYRNCQTRNCRVTLSRSGVNGFGLGGCNLRSLDRLLVEDYEGVAGDNFEVFVPEQHPDYVMPMDEPANEYLRGSPDAGTADQSWLTKYSRSGPDGRPLRPGLTNRQLMEKYGYAWNGQLLPDGAAERAGIEGLVKGA